MAIATICKLQHILRKQYNIFCEEQQLLYLHKNKRNYTYILSMIANKLLTIFKFIAKLFLHYTDFGLYS